MAREYFLFSVPTEEVKPELYKHLFAQGGDIAYMPADGADPNNQRWQGQWEQACASRGVNLVVIDNSKTGQEAELEKEKLLACKSLVICGGNTFVLLENLRASGLDQTIVKLASRKDSFIAGFSAGALILYKDIELAKNGDDFKRANLSDYRGLNLVNTEVCPHYTPDKEPAILAHEQKFQRKVTRLTDFEYIIIEN